MNTINTETSPPLGRKQGYSLFLNVRNSDSLRVAILCIAALFIFAAPVRSQAPPKSQVLAEVDGKIISAEEVDKAIAVHLTDLEEQIYHLRQQKLEALIGDKLLEAEAARRGVTTKALLDEEVTSKVTLVTDKEINGFYQANKAQMKGEEAALREQIRTYLQNQKLAAQWETFLKSLRSKAKVVVHLDPPPIFRAEISTKGAPFKGPEKAPVTIVELADFHCLIARVCSPA